MRSMAGRWSDQDIAASLNRMGLVTGQGKTWTARRVGSLRRVHDIHGYRPAEKSGEWLTLRDAAAKLGVSHHQVRKLIKAGILVSEQVAPDAPHQIRSADLETERVIAALKQPIWSMLSIISASGPLQARPSAQSEPGLLLLGLGTKPKACRLTVGRRAL